MNHARQLVAAILFIIMPAFPTMAGNMMNHETHGRMDSGKQMPAGMNMMGEQIRETTIDDYALTYRLIDMHAQIPDNPEMTGTYHLMILVKDSTGRSITSAMIGYMIKGPDGKTQKAMTMAMGKGFGANINLTEKGKYEITTKAMIGDKKVIDKFTYNPVQ